MSYKKILLIQFRYLGDAVFITPAVKAIQSSFPNAEIHVLVAEEASPIFNHNPLIKKVWGMPRNRTKENIRAMLRYLLRIRKERFDLSINFDGNDRGSISSLIINAKKRLGQIGSKKTFLQRLAYTETFRTVQIEDNWVNIHLKMIHALLNIPLPVNPKPQMNPKPSVNRIAFNASSSADILFHVGTSQPKKEWPIEHWIDLYHQASTAGYQIIFSSGPNQREQAIIQRIKNREPNIQVLPQKNLEDFISSLNEFSLVISGDTGPLHFAAALGKKTIGLFGVDDGVKHYASIYPKDSVILAKPCSCTGELVHFDTCQSKLPCMQSITPEKVFNVLKKRYPLNAL
jgi:heptosyltransferase III